MAIVLDLITFAVGVGFIFVAIGHDAGGTLECTSVNGLCPPSSCPIVSPSPCWTKVQKGFFTCTVPLNGNLCTKTVTFSPSYSVKPNVWTGWNGSVPIPSSTQTVTPAVASPPLTFQTATTAWTVPVASTELNGATAQRLSWTTPATWNSQTAKLCVDLVSTAGAAGFTAQSSPDQTTWTNLGTDGLTVFGDATTGFKCSTVQTTSLAVSTVYYFRAMGSDAFGPAAATIGTVELILSGQTTPGTLTVLLACSETYTVISTSSVNLVTQCGSAGITAATTFTVNWWAGIAA